ncbi:hypothetical protein ATO6_15830 [Oceanicola sp. 22II-s10i]|uniref:hypothetical protein n=1 Tax=Oceanicola sp. 22II-s10i TaxID=1317116 RepID=UPI000B768D26|nr:hypothetical protein [Oceanicola sp. 22II-s10i]OWU83886.1 hypothetical protein ATO6_15830 [Oceanicola sp. 22II-s10i]
MVGRMVKRFALGMLIGIAARQVSRAMARGMGKSARRSRHDTVRDAGPGQMRNPPRRWDRVDEEVDQSFPASDPPGNY